MTIEILTGLLVIITAVYAVLTQRIAKANESAVAAMQAQIRAASRPYVHFDVRLESVFIEATLENRGITSARNIKIICDPALSRTTRTQKEPAVLMNEIIPVLIPNREVIELLGSWHELKETYQTKTHKVTISYQDDCGNNYSDSFNISPSRFAGMHHIGHPTVASELKRIADAISKS